MFIIVITLTVCYYLTLLNLYLFSVDINECNTASETLCPTANNVICQNTAGGYECVCTNSSYRQLQTDLCVSEYCFIFVILLLLPRHRVWIE